MKTVLFDAHYIRKLIKNPVYCGKIAFGRIKSEKVRGTRNEYHRIEAEDYLVVDGLHEAIVSEDLWQAAQIKAKRQAKRYEHAFGKENQRIHLLSGLLRCPVCGAPMYGNKCIKHKPDGTKYKDFFYYGCKHRLMNKGKKCDYRRMVNEEMLDDAVVEVITLLVSRPKFAAMMSDRINTKIDTTEIDQEISTAEKELRHSFTLKAKLIEEIDSLDFDDRHYNKRKADLDERLYGVYDKIDRLESELGAAREKKSVLEADKMTSENIYRILINFEQLYAIMDEGERRKLMEALIAEIQIHEEAKPNGQWLKSIRFRLPIIPEDMYISLDNGDDVECAALLTREK